MKKILSFISFLLAAAMLFGMTGAIGVGAVGADYTVKDVTAYLFTLDDTTTLECVFYDDLPEVPYVDPCDFLGTIYTDTYEQSMLYDGYYKITSEDGDMFIETKHDKIIFPNYDDFTGAQTNSQGSTNVIPFVKGEGGEYVGEVKSLTLDLSQYGIDLTAVDGKAYMPLPTLVDMFITSYNGAEYVDGNIYFIHAMDDTEHDGYFDKSPIYEELTRSESLADFTYKELCFAMDHFYGQPTNSKIAPSIAAYGLDSTLDRYSDMTRLAKEMLQSTDICEYFAGLCSLSELFHDGGHTILFIDPMSEIAQYEGTALYTEWLNRIKTSEEPIYQYAKEATGAATAGRAGLPAVEALRAASYGEYENVNTWGTYATLVRSGNTAVFVFDSFVTEVAEPFVWSLNWAKDEGIENFVIDVSCNGGGLVALAGFMVASMTCGDTHSNTFDLMSETTTSGNVLHNTMMLDLNLDGVFDDADKEVAYDFNFAILSSVYSFSSGNLLPVAAKEKGILILGETSGGGACSLVKHYLADSHFYFVSNTSKFCVESGADVDLGAQPDYELTSVAGDGTVDYSGLYDIDSLAGLIEAFYACEEHVPGDTVTENVIPASDGVNGSHDEVVYCANCGALLSRRSVADYAQVTKNVEAYVFSLERTKEIEAYFPAGLPDCPFISPVDYLNTIYTDEFTMEEGDDGKYTVTNAYGYTMVIDPDADTVCIEDFDSFKSCYLYQEGTSVEINYIHTEVSDVSVPPAPVTIDFARYGIDIPEQNGKVYLPLAALGAMFSLTYNNALYFDDRICFVFTFDPESYYYTLDLGPMFNRMTRSREMANFTYATLCLMIDYFYGKPSSALIAPLLKEMTLDEVLDVYDDVTPVAKQLLLSEDMVEYFLGITLLAYYLDDGGHTCLSNIPINGVNDYYNLPLSHGWLDAIYSDTELGKLVSSYLFSMLDGFNAGDTIRLFRDGEYKKYEDEIVKEFDTGAYLIIHGDAAVFVFNSYDADTPYDFKESLEIAKEKGVSAFIVDNSCNGGGYTAAFSYICAVMRNAKNHTNKFHTYNVDPLTGMTTVYEETLDLNLDGVFDDADCDFVYDFDFAVMSSNASFSSGNALPIFAGMDGIMILGEASGGGSCNVTEHFLADGYQFPISDLSMYRTDEIDFDLGCVVDAQLVTVDDEGNKDYSALYDLDNVIALVKAFYHKEEPGDLDGDGDITMKDVLLMRRYIAGLDTLEDYEITLGDFDGDGDITMKDVLRARRIIAGLE